MTARNGPGEVPRHAAQVDARRVALAWSMLSAAGLLAAAAIDPYVLALACGISMLLSTGLVILIRVFARSGGRWTLVALLPTILALCALWTTRWA
ncbi:MAG: hypothetical protein AB7O21_14450 [Gammaproteobacteria bacterium]